MNLKDAIMINNKQQTNWTIDAMLFGGLICAFFMDETGLPFHQWLGIAVGILSNYHLLTHWNWVKSVARQFFGKTAGKARMYIVMDSAMAIGFLTIVSTGLAMSTWLDLQLTNYLVWKTVHITASVFTLLATMIKISLHWKWIVKTARRLSFSPSVSSPQLAEARIPVTSQVMVGRRDFLKMMGVVGAAAIWASVKAFDELESQATVDSQNQTTQSEVAQSQSVSTTANQSTNSTAVSETSSNTVAQQSDTYVTNVVESGSSVSCASQCRDNCSFPGRCHKYIDSNGNGRCDNSECA